MEGESKGKFLEELRKRSKNQKRQIKIYRSGIKLPPSNHPATLRLTESLSKTQDLSIFETKLIQIYLQKRWEDSLRFFILDYVFILSGLFVLFLHAAFFRSLSVATPLLPLQLWNLVIESIELNNKGCRAYFSDFWNYFDILRFVFTFTYFGVAMTGDGLSSTDTSSKTDLLTLLSFAQSVKAFQIFSLFKSTRVLLRIVNEIVKDIVAFMLFVLATTVTVALLFTSATPDAELENDTYVGNMMHVFRLDFGDFEPDEYSQLDKAIFILAVLVVPLIFLNMLIAIMGDTFDRVKEEQGRRDFQEMAGLVYRYEIIGYSVCKWKKRVTAWKYIFVSEDVKYSGEEAIDVWEGRIRGIKLEIKKNFNKWMEWQGNFEKKFAAEQQKSEEWKKKYEADQQRSEEKWAKTEQLLSKILSRIEEVFALTKLRIGIRTPRRWIPSTEQREHLHS